MASAKSSEITALVPALLRDRLANHKSLPIGIIEQREAVVACIRIPPSETQKTIQVIDRPGVISVVLNTLYDSLVSSLANAEAIITEMDIDGLTAVFLLETSAQAGRVYQSLVSIENALAETARKSPPGYPDVRWYPAAGVGVGSLALTVVHSTQQERSVFLIDGPTLAQAKAARDAAQDGQLVAHRDVMKRLGSAMDGKWVKSQFFVPTTTFANSAVGQMFGVATTNHTSPHIPTLNAAAKQTLAAFLDPALLPTAEDAAIFHRGTQVRQMTCMVLRIAELSLSGEADIERWQLILDKVLGTIARYSGIVYHVIANDGQGEIYAIFRESKTQENANQRTVSCALALRRALHTYERQLHIGMATGAGFIGFMGNDYYHGLVVIGEPVLQAKALARRADTHETLATEAICTATEGIFSWRQLTDQSSTFALTGEVVLGSGLITRVKIAQQTPLIGREAEIERLQTLMKESQQNKEHRFLIIRGQAGHGRSALIETLVDQWLMAGGNGFVAIGPAYTPAAPYALWFPIWQALFDLSQEAAPEENMERLEAAFTRLLPEFEGGVALFADVLGLANDETIRGLSAQARQQRLLDANSVIFRQIADLTPILLAFEYLEYTDSLSLELLSRLSMQLEGAAVFICLEDRSDRSHTLQKTFPDAEIIDVPPLSGQDAWRLFNTLMPKVHWPYSHRTALESRLGSEQDAQPGKRGPSPAFVVALATALRQSVLEQKRGKWQIRETYPPQGWPRDLAETTDLLLETTLKDYETQVAVRASVAGALFYHNAPWLKVTGASADLMLEIARMRALHLTEAYIDMGHGQRWDRFRHEEIRQTLYLHMDLSTRTELHQMVADWHRQHQPGSGGQATVAYHTQHAGQSLAAVEAYLNACEHAITWGADAEASQNLLAAERLLTLQDAEKTREAFAKVYLVRVRLRLNQTDYEKGIADANRALRYAEQAENPVPQAQALILRAHLHHLQADHEAAQKDAEQAASLAQDSSNSDLLAQALWLQARTLNANQQHRQAARLLKRALAASSSRDIPLQIKMGLDAAEILLADYQRDRAQGYAYRAYERAQAIGDPVPLHQVMKLIGHLQVLYGQAEQAVETLEQALSLPAPPESGLGHLGQILTDHAIALCYLGRYVEAEAAFETAIGYAPDDDAYINAIRASELYLDRNQLTEAQAALDNAQAFATATPSLKPLIDLTQAAIYTHQRKFDEAKALLEAQKNAPDSPYKHWYAPLCYVREAELALAQGQPTVAAQLATQSLGAVSVQGDLRYLTLAYCLLAESLILNRDNSTTIQDALERAIRMGRDQGRRLHLARALYLLGNHIQQTALRFRSRALASTYLFEADLLFKQMDLAIDDQIPSYILQHWADTKETSS